MLEELVRAISAPDDVSVCHATPGVQDGHRRLDFAQAEEALFTRQGTPVRRAPRAGEQPPEL